MVSSILYPKRRQFSGDLLCSELIGGNGDAAAAAVGVLTTDVVGVTVMVWWCFNLLQRMNRMEVGI